MPGVESVGISSMLPVIGGNTMWIRVMGHPFHGEHNEVGYRQVSSAYFTTLRAKLLRGRYFTEADDASKPPVVIIDRALAEKYFPGEDPVGKQIAYSGADSPPMQVVGIVEDIKEGALDETTWPTLYVAYNQDPDDHFSLVVRTSKGERALLPTLAAAIHRIDPGIATFDPRTMSDRIDNTPAAYLRRCSAWLVGGFAAAWRCCWRRRPLRRDRVFGKPQDPRDRSSHGARRAAASGVPAHPERGGLADRRRYRHRSGLRGGCGESVARPAFGVRPADPASSWRRWPPCWPSRRYWPATFPRAGRRRSIR